MILHFTPKTKHEQNRTLWITMNFSPFFRTAKQKMKTRKPRVFEDIKTRAIARVFMIEYYNYFFFLMNAGISHSSASSACLVSYFFAFLSSTTTR